MSRLEGRTVVMTGAGGGIGSLVARRLRGEGARVIGVDRSPGTDCDETLACDLSDPVALAALAGTLAARPVDILVNVAGAQYFGEADAQGLDSIRLCYAVNLIAPAALTRAVLPGMLARGRGQIVNIGSAMGAIPYPYFATYSSSKAGLKALSEALRREVGGRGIAVTHVAPRAVKTAFNNAAVNRFLERVKMRADDPGDVADVIVRAILARRNDVAIGAAERFYARLNALAPRLIDRGLAGQAAKARTLFSHS
ncbi:SDR family NAD(P)-dependent oxidoreductase [Sphingomonas sp. CJ20]